MHELSLCASIVEIVERARQGRPVETVHVRVGQLRQVVPETLVHCWRLVTEATPLAGSALVVDHVPVVVRCRGCGSRTEVAELLLLACVACGSGRVTVVCGEEFLVTSLEVDDTTDPPAPLPEGGD